MEIQLSPDVDEVEEQFFFSMIEMGEYCMMVGDIGYDVYIFISGAGEGWGSCGNLLGTISKESYT